MEEVITGLCVVSSRLCSLLVCICKCAFSFFLPVPLPFIQLLQSVFDCVYVGVRVRESL